MSSTITKHSKRTIRKPCDRCGATNLYWAHDNAIEDVNRSRWSSYSSTLDGCTDCLGAKGKWVLIDAESLMPHALTCKGRKGNAPKPAPAPVPAPSADVPADTPDVPADVPVTAPETASPAPSPLPAGIPTGAPTDALTALSALMDALAPKVDRNEVAAMIKEQIADVVFPTRTVIIRDDSQPVEIEGAHFQTDLVLRALAAKRHVMMCGPAGTGKSTLAETSADALGLPFYSKSCHPMMTPTELMGFIDATGTYRRTVFRDAFENGGVFLFDEIDNASAPVMAAMNAALANRRMAFPDGMVWRHPDFKVVAAANTYGRGGDRKYQRQTLDAATLDRFIVRDIDYDPAIEHAVCVGTGADADTIHRVISHVHRIRENAAKHNSSLIFGIRASEGMCALLASGDTWAQAEDACLRKGASDADWAKLTA